MNKWQKKQRSRFIAGMVGYMVVLAGSLTLINSGRFDNPVIIGFFALLPVIPLVAAITAVVNNVREQDEMVRRISLEAILITTLLTGGLTFSYGLLESAGLVPPISLIFVAPFMIITWGIANAVITRRYA